MTERISGEKDARKGEKARAESVDFAANALGDDELSRVAGGRLEEDMSKPCVNDVIRISVPLYWDSLGVKVFPEHYEGKERVMQIDEGSRAPYCVLTHFWVEASSVVSFNRK